MAALPLNLVSNSQTFNGLVCVRTVLVYVDSRPEKESSTNDADEASHVEGILHAHKLNGYILLLAATGDTRYLIRDLYTIIEKQLPELPATLSQIC